MALTRADLESRRLQQMIGQSGLDLHVFSEAELQASIAATLCRHPPNTDVWIFAYGSLIWNPVFHFTERRQGKIHGWHRQFCLWTPLGRGTPENPGLVLGLDRGGSCRGIAYQIATTEISSELLLIWRREMVVGSYIPQWVRVSIDNQVVEAIAFVINRHSSGYAGKLPTATMIDNIATATGALGTCAEYLMQTVDGLLSENIYDKHLMILRDRVIEKQRSLETQGSQLDVLKSTM